MDSQQDIVKGELYTWGWNNGQLGHEVYSQNSSGTEEKNNTNVHRPQKISGQPEEFKTRGIKLIACGASHNVVITADDNIYVFGRNQNGQLGLGHKDNVTKPTLLQFEEFKEKDNSVVQVACGDRHTVFVTCKGLVYACGANFNGQLGLGHNSDRDIPTLLKYMQHLRVKKVACGSRHTILMLHDGTLYSTGHGLMGQLGIGSNLDVNIPMEIGVSWKATSVHAKEHMTVAKTTNFDVYMWGGMKFREGIEDTNHPERSNWPRFVTGNICGRRVREVIAAPQHCYARTSDGSLYGWGYSVDDMGYIQHLPNGLTEYGVFKEDEELTDLAKDCKRKSPNLDEKHIVKNIKDPLSFTLYKNSFLPQIATVCTTNHCTYCVQEDGSVLVFGCGKSGELGVGESVQSADYPVQIPDFKVKKLVSGYWHALAIV